MTWHDIADPNDAALDELAQRYKLDPLHILACRSGRQRAKIESEGRYLFIVLKSLVLEANKKLIVGDLDVFMGPEFLITVHSIPVPVLEAFRQSDRDLRADEVLFRIIDGVVDSYLPLLEEIQARLESVQREVVDRPSTTVVEQIDDIRAVLLELRRALLNMRHVAFRLQHTRSELIDKEFLPFLRDIHDHLSEDLDTIAGELNRLVGVLDTYLSTIANHHTEAMRALTLLGTAALPALVVSTIFGMNVKYPQWVNSPWAFEAILSFAMLLTFLLWWYLRRQN